MIRIKKKTKTMVLLSMLIVIFLISSMKSIPNVLADDNYSTYMYNQDIQIDNDKAHLFQESSDGSNSYRNLFESNFLFPAKLQDNMLSTTKTTEFTHYSFNQFYFDNLRNDYNYGSQDYSESYNSQSIIDNLEVDKGISINNGSIENNNSEFGKYNATYTFDDYQETESNYGNYNGTYSFENEVGLTQTDISFVDLIQTYAKAEIIPEYIGHESVLNFTNTITADWRNLKHYSLSNTFNEVFEFWINNNDNNWHFVQLYDVNRLILFGATSGNWYFYNQTKSSYQIITSHNPNQWYYIKLELFIDNTWSLAIDGIEYITKWNFENNYVDGLDSITFRLQNIIGTSSYIDGIGIQTEGYNENDNCNPYGLQSELENDFGLAYRVGNEYYVNNTNSYRDNTLVMVDNSVVYYPQLTNTFTGQISGVVEFSLLVNDSTQYTNMKLDWTGIQLGIRNGYFRYNTGSSWVSTGIEVNVNQFYNHKVVFDCNTDKYHWYINEILVIENMDFMNALDSISTLYIYTVSTHTDYYLVIDNIDYSWTNGYYDNRINDLIPLDDSTYTSFISNKTDIVYETFELFYVNQDIQTDFTGSTPHWSKLDDYEGTADYIEIDKYANAIGDIEILGFQDFDVEYENINITGIQFRWYTSQQMTGTYTDFDVSTNLDDFTQTYNWHTHLIPPTGQWHTFNYWNDNEMTIQEFNELEIKFEITNHHYSFPPFAFYSMYVNVFTERFNNELDIEKEQDIEYEQINEPVLYTLYYSLSSNSLNNTFNISIYNYDLADYYLINSTTCYASFTLNSFVFNESSYFRLNKFKIRIESISNIEHFLLFIDSLYINITYVQINSNGYQEFKSYSYKYDNIDTELGYYLFELRIYKDFILYRYSEINYENDDYIYIWTNVSTSEIDLKNIELQIHCRFGLNTLDIEIINFYAIIYLNYDIMIEFREQERKEFNSHKIKSSFNYTSVNQNYLNLTGIIGNYSYNAFAGCRSLYGNVDEIFHRYFQVPYFSQDIDVSIPLTLPEGSYDNPDEPELPSSYYWTYETYRTVYADEISFEAGNWTLGFKRMKAEIYTAKHIYYPQSVDKDEFPSFKFQFKFSSDYSFTIDLNFFRNTFVSILNLVLLFGQWVGFMIMSSLSYLFMYIGSTILVFIWNTLIYYLFYTCMIVLWYIVETLVLVLLAIWSGLVWVYENLLIPFLEYLESVVLPWLLIKIIEGLAWGITATIWVLTLGQIDFDSTYSLVLYYLWVIVYELLAMIDIFIKNLFYIALFLGLYLYNMLLLYFTFLYCRSRGMVKKANKMYKTLMFYLTPILFIYDFIKKLTELSPM